MMQTKMHARKEIARSTSKHVVAEKRDISVTEKEIVTGIARNGPRKRYSSLAPWLALANLLPANAPHPVLAASALQVAASALHAAAGRLFLPPRLTKGTERLDPQLRNRADEVWFFDHLYRPQDAGKLYVLAHAARETFEAIERAKRERAAGEDWPAFAAAAHPAEFVLDPSGRIGRADADLFHGRFLPALAGLEAARLGCCEVCARYFYALRTDQKACSKDCSTALRVRRHRAKQADYEENRKWNEYARDVRKGLRERTR